MGGKERGVLTWQSREGRGGSGAEFGVEWEEGGLAWSLRGDAAAGARGFFSLVGTEET